ncbi:e3 ubiquitin-protein ligase RNF13 [Trichonephila clavipes]|nr:e3 ubiquitin-protein ligase RNF13 [Trichonephila clavipes]
MAPGRSCISGYTCGCRMSWTYRWAVRVPRINTRGDRVLYSMAPRTITSTVGVVCRCKAKARLRRSPRGLQTRTRLSSLLRLNLNSSLKTHDLVQFRCSPFSSVHGTTPNRGVDVWASRAAHVMGASIPNVFQQGAFVWFERTQGPLMKVLPVPGWRPIKQLALRVHLTMKRSSRQLICRACPEPGLCVKDIS